MAAITQAPNSGVIASADSTGLIKIWSAQKMLIREIQFPEPVNSLWFISAQGDLMIGHDTTLSLVTAKQIMIGLPPVKQLNEAMLIALAFRVDNELMYSLNSVESVPEEKKTKKIGEESNGSSDYED